MRVYTNSKAADVYIDDVYFSAKALGVKADEGKHVLFDGETVPAGMTIPGTKGFTVSSDYVKEGKGAILSGEIQVRLVYNFDALDISAYEGGYLHMWVYVTDYDTIKSGQIELTSSGTCDSGEMGWDVKNYIKANGWNEIWLPLSYAESKATGGNLDLTGANYLRLFTLRQGDTSKSAMYFDDVYFTKTK